MGWSAALLAALKALPELVSAVKELHSTYINVANSISNSRIDSIQAEVNEILAKVKQEDDRDKLLELARRLNDARSK